MNKITIFITILLLSACTNIKNIISDKKEPNLSGDRTYVIKSEMIQNFDNDPQIIISPAESNKNSFLNSSNNVIENIKYNNNYQKKRYNISNTYSIYSNPSLITIDEFTYIQNDRSVKAYKKNELNKPIWTIKTNSTGSNKSFIGGGMSYNRGNIYITAGHNEVISINALNGKEIWRYKMNNISRAAPYFYDDKLFILTIDNVLYALNSNDGTTLWRFEGAGDDIGIYSYPSVTVANDIVIVPNSSGQLHALSAINGEEIWSVDLAYSKSSLEGFIFNNISTTPIIKNDFVYIAGNMGYLYAIELYNGQFVWRKDIKNIKSLWINDDFIYAIDSNVLNAINIKNGSSIWTKNLNEIETKKEKNIIYYGPIIANDELIIASDKGQVIFISPFDGKILKTQNFSKSLIAMPLFTESIIYLLENSSKLSVLK